MTCTHERRRFRRFGGLLDGWFTGWLRDCENAHPRAVYERAIAERQKQYQQLKQGVAGVLYMRNKIEGELKECSRELSLVKLDLERAIRRGLDDVALDLIAQKERLGEELERSEKELEQVVAEVESSKQNLARFRTEIQGLEREKVRALASLANARARRRIQSALAGMSTEAEEAALENVRAEIARLRYEGRLDQEMGDSGLRARVQAFRNEARCEAHRRELDELKQRLGRSVKPTVGAPEPMREAPPEAPPQTDTQGDRATP